MGVPLPDCEGLKDLTFWVWPESLWAPISFTKAYLEQSGNEDEVSKWWDDDDAAVYQFIGEGNIYFYAIAQTGLFTGLKCPKGTHPDMERMHMSHIVANRHLLYMDIKASSSSEIKPPTADELLKFYAKDQLRMHFMSLGLSTKSAGFKPQIFMEKEEQTGVDMVLKEGNLITNVFNRLIRSCFYAIQNNYAGKIPEGEVNPRILEMAESTVLEYERYMYNHEFHRISYLLDDFIRAIYKHWVNNVKLADFKGDVELRRQIVVDCFYACKVMAILVHPIAPEGCEMFRLYEISLKSMNAPGCITCGETVESAVANAMDAKKAWLEAALEEELTIHEPDSIEDYSGQFKLRIPKSLHRLLAEHFKK